MAEPTSMTVMMPRLEADRVAIELHSGKPSLDDVANETYLDSFVELRPNKRGQVKVNGLYLEGKTLLSEDDNKTADMLDGKYIAIRHVDNDIILGTCQIHVEYFDEEDDGQ